MMTPAAEFIENPGISDKYSDEVAALLKLCPGIADGVVPPDASPEQAAVLIIEYLAREKNQLARDFRMRSYQAQELLVEKILRGNFKLAAEVEDKLRLLEIHMESPMLLPVLVQTKDGSNMFFDSDQNIRDKGQLALIVSSVFSELLSARGSCNAARMDDKYAFLVSPPRGEDGSLPEAQPLIDAVVADCRYGIDFVRDNFSLELRAVVGEPVQGVQNVHLSFRQILDMSEYTVDPAGEAVVTARTMQKKDELIPLHQDTAMEKQYLNAVVTFDFNTACTLTMDKLHTLYSRYGQSEIVRLRPFIAARLSTTSNILAVSFDDLADANGVTAASLFSEAFASEDFSIICKAIRRIYQLLDARFNAARADVSGTAGKVISFVHRHYADPDLSVENICDSLGKSRSYMSRMFKENTGMNLLDFLHTTRLTEAKKLLTETDQSISDIACQVGYYSGWTLARVFKRYEGITPTAYRRAYKDEGQS